MATHAEALNYLLTMLKMDGFSLIKGEKYVPTTSTQEIIPSPKKEIVAEKKSVARMPEFDEYQVDPIIQRLINAGLEMEF